MTDSVGYESEFILPVVGSYCEMLLPESDSAYSIDTWVSGIFVSCEDYYGRFKVKLGSGKPEECFELLVSEVKFRNVN